MSPSIEVDRNLEHLVFEIANGVSGETGDAFFHSLVDQLAHVLEAAYVFAGTLDPDGQRVAALAVHGSAAGGLTEFRVSDSPCAIALEQPYSYASGVRRLFPQDHVLERLQAEGFAGSPILDSGGRRLGLIC